MTVSDAEGNQIRYIQFFTSPYNVETKLTKLDSVRISAPGSQPRTYRFDYYWSASVPNRDTRGIDHWGFFNGKGNYAGGVPTIYTKLEFSDGIQTLPLITDTIEGANREPIANCTQCGVLKEIVHPEGAVTDFEYEGNAGAFLMYYRGNNYEDNAYYAYPVGGLRIAKITESVLNEYLQKQVLNVKLYKYGLYDGCCSPVMGGGVIKHIVTNRDYCFESNKKWQNMGDRYVKTWQAMPISNITFNNGSAVFYTFVQEETKDENANITITSKYYYDMPPHAYSDIFSYDNQYNPTKIVTGYWDLVNMQNSPNYNYSRIVRKAINCPYDVYEQVYNSNNDWRHGHLKRVEHYNKDKLLVSSTDYYYNSNSPNGNGFQIWVYKPYCISRFVADNTLPWNNPGGWPNFYGEPVYWDDIIKNSEYVSNSWQMDVFNWKALEKETTQQYFYGNGTVDTVTTVKNYQYDDEYEHTNPTIITSANFKQTIEDNYTYHKGMVNILSYHKRTVNNSALESEIVFTGTRPQKVRYKTSNMNDYDDKIIYDSYDNYGNIAEISTDEGKHTCYVWSYGNQHPIAEIENITYPELLQALNKDTIWISQVGAKYQPSEQDMNLLNGLRSQLPNSRVSTFTYKPLLGVSSIVDPSGFTTYYEYDNYGRLTEAFIVENGQKKVLQTNEYHTGNGTDALSAGLFEIVGFNVKEGSILESGQEYPFKVYMYGGSGNFTYEWDLFWGDEYCDIWRGDICGNPPNPNYHEIHYEEPSTSMNEVTMTPQIPGDNTHINKLKIWVTDNVTGEERILRTWFYVE